MLELFLTFLQAAIGTALLYTGIKWAHGTISGSTEDEEQRLNLRHCLVMGL